MAERLDKAGLTRFWRAVQIRVSEMVSQNLESYSPNDQYILTLDSGTDSSLISTSGKYFIPESQVSNIYNLPSVSNHDLILEVIELNNDNYYQILETVPNTSYTGTTRYIRSVSSDGLSNTSWQIVYSTEV